MIGRKNGTNEKDYKVEIIWEIQKTCFMFKKLFWEKHYSELMELEPRLTKQKMLLLNVIILNGQHKKKNIANSLSADQGNISKVIDKMYEFNLLEKRKDGYFIEKKFKAKYMRILREFYSWFYDAYLINDLDKIAKKYKRNIEI